MLNRQQKSLSYYGNIILPLSLNFICLLVNLKYYIQHIIYDYNPLRHFNILHPSALSLLQKKSAVSEINLPYSYSSPYLRLPLHPSRLSVTELGGIMEVWWGPSEHTPTSIISSTQSSWAVCWHHTHLKSASFGKLPQGVRHLKHMLYRGRFPLTHICWV